MVSFCCEIFLLCAAALMLTFFIAGLLFICALSTSITWERTPHPVRRPAFSSSLITSTRQLLLPRRPPKPGVTEVISHGIEYPVIYALTQLDGFNNVVLLAIH